MKNLIIAVLLFSAIIETNAQQVSACYKYNEKGEAIEPNTVWNMSSAGGNLYLLFNNNNTRIHSRRLTINIDKLNGNEYKGYEIKTLKADTTKTWAVLDYFFKDDGQYRVSYLDSNYKMLASSEFLIKKVADSPVHTNNNKADAFKSSSIVFCTKIDAAGNPIGSNNLFSIGKDGGAVKVKVSNPYPFNTDKFFADVYKKTRHGEYELEESQNYPIFAGNATWVYFTYVFTAPGEYKLAVYTKDNRYINTGFVTIIKTP